MNKDNEDLKDLFGEGEVVDISLSYSRLSDFDRNGPSVLIKRNDPQGYGLKMGSVIDDLALPEDGFIFEEEYLVSDFNKPTATTAKLVDIILKNYIRLPTLNEVLEICNLNEFWKASLPETRIAKFNNDEFWGYLNVHIQANTKSIITSNEYEEAKDIVYVLQTHEYSKHILKNEFTNYNQFKIKFKYNGITFKGVLDKMIINHTNKTVQMIDLKTGADEALSFMNSYLRYRYYLQAIVYTKAFKHICKELGLKGYSLLPFQFLYIGRKERIPLVYTVTKKWHKAAQYGFNIKEYVYKGLDELIEDVKWHFSKREFELSRKIHESNGNINLNDNFIDVNK